MIGGQFLNHVVTIERATPGAKDERGEPAQTWSTLATVRASVQPLSDADLMQLGQGGPVESTWKVYIEPTDVTDADRLREGSRTLQIDSKSDQGGAGHHIRLDCHEVAG